MFEDKLKSVIELEDKAKAARMALEQTRVAELKSLPSRFGYESLNDFVKALKDAAGKRMPKGSKGAKGAKGAKAPKAPKAKGGKGSRARITDDVRNKIIADLQAGTKKAAAIAKEYKISYPSVMLIKKKAGLVKVKAAIEAAPAV